MKWLLDDSLINFLYVAPTNGQLRLVKGNYTASTLRSGRLEVYILPNIRRSISLSSILHTGSFRERSGYMACYVHSMYCTYVAIDYYLHSDYNAKHLSTIKTETGHKMYSWILTASCCSDRQLQGAMPPNCL